MAPIAVDWSVLNRDAEAYSAARDSGRAAISALAGTLDKNWGCAGKCDSAKDFSKQYDPAAAKAYRAGERIVNAYGKMHDLLAYTAVNHQNAESAAKTPPSAIISAPSSIEHYSAPGFRGAYGRKSSEPRGWSLVAPLVTGHDWPNGDPGKLRNIAQAWRDAAKSLRAASSSTCAAGTEISEQESPELDQAAEQVALVSDCVEDVASFYEDLAEGCDSFADAIEDTQDKIRGILKHVLEAGGAGLIIGGILGSVLPGLGTAIGGGIGAEIGAGSAIAGAAAEIVPLLSALAALAEGAAIGAAIGGVSAGAISVANNLEGLLSSAPSAYIANRNADNPRSGMHQPTRAKPNPEAFPGLDKATAKTKIRGGGGLRRRWTYGKGQILEEDTLHGTLEKYDKRGKHLGEFDPETGAQLKPADPNKTVEP